MIEIILLVLLTRHHGQMARAKGHDPMGYQVLTVLLWIFLEILGIFIGVAMSGGNVMTGILFALLGVALAAAISHSVVKGLPDRTENNDNFPRQY